MFFILKELHGTDRRNPLRDIALRDYGRQVKKLDCSINLLTFIMEGSNVPLVWLAFGPNEIGWCRLSKQLKVVRHHF